LAVFLQLCGNLALMIHRIDRLHKPRCSVFGVEHNRLPANETKTSIHFDTLLYELIRSNPRITSLCASTADEVAAHVQ
jgi:hypothetical protein